ncbi:MAG: hypothetical protein NTY14_08825 [Candidatus Omnitrophica bacterium]|nr:hypothetical protein [Candidatus Omnitrophota bacterium]
MLLSASDTEGVRNLLQQAKNTNTLEDFQNRIKLGKFTSNHQRNKYKVFQTLLKKANNGVAVTDEEIWRFLKSFNLLIYDLDFEGIILSLLLTLIGQYSQNNAKALWTQILDKVERVNENAGELDFDSVSKEIGFEFRGKAKAIIPEELVPTPIQTVDWNQQAYSHELAFASLIGYWNESSDADKNIVGQLTKGNYSMWIPKIREVLQIPESPITIKNGIWSVIKRKDLWQALGPRIFDETLEIFKQCVVTVLSERDPKFELAPEERYAASIHGKVMKHSLNLRKGLAESLAILGSYPKALVNCSSGKPETITILAIREIFRDADWLLWGSLNNLLPLLAEAAPNEFLDAVENSLKKTPCPFDMLFSQEGKGVLGSNYLTGLLWALETLAWEEEFLVRVTVILGELASRDPGGNWANRPSNSLTTIFLPWLPQTMAPIDKRKTAVKTLQKELSEICWKLLLNLLPNQHQMSSGSAKPIWRKKIPENLNKTIVSKDYRDQILFYVDLAIDMAKGNIPKLTEMVQHLHHLPPESFDKILSFLSSTEITSQPEGERVGLWMSLTELITRHKHFSDAKWALSPENISKIETVTNALVPTDLINLHRRLFTERDYELIDNKGDWDSQQAKLEVRRQEAIRQILDSGGVEAIFNLIETVDASSKVGFSLASLATPEIDSAILPSLLNKESSKLTQFVAGYIWGMYRKQGWSWVDGIDVAKWSKANIAKFLIYLPFTNETWKRVENLLRDSEKEYWGEVSVNPYQTEKDLSIAIDKLVEYGRPKAAISCLNKIVLDKQPINCARAVKVLLSALASRETYKAVDAYDIIEIIKALQDSKDVNPDELCKIELGYLEILDEHHNARPKLLESNLAAEPSFFCEVIRLLYRSKKETKSNKEPSEEQKAIASKAWKLLDGWKTPPGMQPDATFKGGQFKLWLETVVRECIASGHLEVALLNVGKVLFYSPHDPSGLWIHKDVAEAFNGVDADRLRRGFSQEMYNSRGVHWVDPTGKPERELAEKCRKQANDVENAGFQRFAVTLREMAESYDKEAERIIREHKAEEEEE